ncbi:MAG: nucleotidyl transferase AbiEii/AbiGii toxin family protein [Xanthobacteraceae bacterium]
MNVRATSIKSAISDFMVRRGIPGEMEQNLIKEAIHLHLLSALSEAGVLRHVVFQGGTALRLCYGGERYSEDLDFVCGKAGAYIDKIEFENLVGSALETTKKSLHREFDINPDEILLKQPPFPMAIRSDSARTAAWQISVPVASLKHSPKSRIKIEFANVPSYDSGPDVAKSVPGLVQIEDVILTVESTSEILADKAVALTARQALKYRDVWDVWYLTNKLNAQINRAMVANKFSDYGTSDVETKAKQRREELANAATEKAFLDEMTRFLPAKRVLEIDNAGLQKPILAASADLISRAVL